MNTSQSRLVREAGLRELDAGRYVHIRPQRLPPECLDRVHALADKHGIDRDVARRLAAELHDGPAGGGPGSRTGCRAWRGRGAGGR
jgi:hypothetical protein